MKKQFTFILICISSLTSIAQRPASDSLFNILSGNAPDSVKVNAGMAVVLFYQRDRIDTLIYYSEKIVGLGKTQRNPRIEAAGLLGLAYANGRKPDYNKFFEFTQLASEKEEKYPDKLLRAYINNFNAFFATDEDAVYLMRKSVVGYQAFERKDPHSVVFLTNLVSKLRSTNKPDSARFYGRRAELLAEEIGDTLNDIFVYLNLGNFYLDTDKNTAFFYLQKALAVARRTGYDSDYSSAYHALTKYYVEMSNWDSVVYYGEEADMLDEPDLAHAMYNSAMLYAYYRHLERDYREAADYADDFFENLDSLFGPILEGKFQKIAFSEIIKQEKKEAEKKELEKQERKDLQKIILALIIASLVILFILVSRAIFVSFAFIRYMGVITLLLAFEYINLVVEPFLEKYIGEYIPLMLVTLATIAAVLAPVHHHLTKWVDKKVVENRKRKRAHAQETLKKLGEMDDQ